MNAENSCIYTTEPTDVFMAILTAKKASRFLNQIPVITERLYVKGTKLVQIILAQFNLSHPIINVYAHDACPSLRVSNTFHSVSQITFMRSASGYK